MHVRKGVFRRAFSFFLASVLVLLGAGGGGLDASAACPAKTAMFYYGYDTMAGGGFIPKSFSGGEVKFSPSAGLNVGGKEVPAYCLDHGLAYPGSYGSRADFSCIDGYNGHYLNLPTKQAILGAILQRSESIGGIKFYTSDEGLRSIESRYGSTSSDRWLITQVLIWSLMGKDDSTYGIFFQANGRIGVSAECKADVESAIRYLRTGNASRQNAARDYANRMYSLLDWMYRVPSFASYTSLHPMGDKIDGHPGVNGGTGTIILDKRDKLPDGTYRKVVHDDNGVLNAFKESMWGAWGSGGFSGVGLDFDDNNNMIITYDGSTGCWEDEAEFERDLPAGAGSVVYWHTGNARHQKLCSYTPTTSKLGCRVKLVIKDCGETPDAFPSPSASMPIVSESPGIATETPPVKTPETYIRKTSDDGNVAGITFTITGNGEKYYKVTDENGFIDVSDLPQYIPGTQQLVEYHAEEEIPVEYIHDRDNASKNFVLKPGETQIIEFSNKHKQWKLVFKKHDSDLATQAQGKGTLAGAEFSLYRNGEYLATYVSDENGVIETDYWPCGPGYTIQEATPPDGYRVDGTVYRVGLMPGETLEQFNECNRLEPLDGDDADVIRKFYSVQSAIEYEMTNKEFHNLN